MPIAGKSGHNNSASSRAKRNPTENKKASDCDPFSQIRKMKCPHSLYQNERLNDSGFREKTRKGVNPIEFQSSQAHDTFVEETEK